MLPAVAPLLRALLAIYPALSPWVEAHPEIPAAVLEADR